MDDNSLGMCILPGETKYIKAKEFELNDGVGIFSFLGDSKNLETKGFHWDLGKYLLRVRQTSFFFIKFVMFLMLSRHHQSHAVVFDLISHISILISSHIIYLL